MRSELSKVLDDCIERISKGEAIETCLAKYPNIRQRVEPLLRTALSISSVPKVQPSPEFIRISKARLMIRIRQESAQTEATKSGQQISLFDEIALAWERLWRSITGPRRLGIIVTTVVLLALVASLYQLAGFGLLSPSPALAAPCTLSILNGSVEIQNSGLESWQPGSDGMVLSQGTRVKTTSDSHALLTFFEGSTIKLEPNTEIEIQKVKHGEQQVSAIALKQRMGKTWSRVVKMTDSSSHYQVETPTARAVVRGTLFTTEVDESGSTQIATTEGLVRVIAQGREIYLPAGQQTHVETGVAPSQPVTMPDPKSEILITFDKPAIGSVSDPAGSSVGLLPSGLAYNQITGAQSSSSHDDTQVIVIPQPISGEYVIVLRYVEPGTAYFSIQGKSKGEAVFQYVGTHEATGGSEWLIRVSLDVQDGMIIDGEVSEVEPLGHEAPEKIVETELTVQDERPAKPSGQGDEGRPDSDRGQGKDKEKDDKESKDDGQDKGDKQDQGDEQGKDGGQDKDGKQDKRQDKDGGQGKGDERGKDDSQDKDGKPDKGSDKNGSQGKGNERGQTGEQDKGSSQDKDGKPGKGSDKNGSPGSQ